MKQAPKITGVPTGVEGLDELFFTVEVKDGKPVKKSLGGIPTYAVFNVTGVSDTGKSLFVEQFTVAQAARGEKWPSSQWNRPQFSWLRGWKCERQPWGTNQQRSKRTSYSSMQLPMDRSEKTCQTCSQRSFML